MVNGQMKLSRHGVALVMALVAVLSCTGFYQTEPSQPSGPDNITRKIGTLTSIEGSALVMKTDDGQELKAFLQDNARIVRISPGEKDLKNALPMTAKELRAGDRILIVVKPAADAAALSALSLVAIRQTDVEQKQAKEREDWQKRGVGGIVKSMDAATGGVTIGITPSYNVLVNTSKATSFFRYSPNSIRFSDAKSSSFAEIHIGDQLRARGTRTPDQKQVAAEEVISGSFRNIAGTVIAVDAANGTLTVKDMVAKKTVVVKVTSDSHLQKLSPVLAQNIASLLKATPQAGPGSAPPGGGSGGEKPASPPDVQQMLTRARTITLADLQNDNAVIIVSTPGNGRDGLMAVTVLSGVERILTAAPTTALLADWNLASALNDPTQ